MEDCIIFKERILIFFSILFLQECDFETIHSHAADAVNSGRGCWGCEINLSICSRRQEFLVFEGTDDERRGTVVGPIGSCDELGGYPSLSRGFSWGIPPTYIDRDILNSVF